MSMDTNNLGYIQQCYFEVCDLLNGQSYQDLGYDNRTDLLEEFKHRLEQIEERFKQLTGLQDQ